MLCVRFQQVRHLCAPLIIMPVAVAVAWKLYAIPTILCNIIRVCREHRGVMIHSVPTGSMSRRSGREVCHIPHLKKQQPRKKTKKKIHESYANSLFFKFPPTGLSLSSGLFDGNASNARLLTQFILTASDHGNLSLAHPSAAEALAVLAGCTLLQSATDAPFSMFWNHTHPTIQNGEYQHFNASLRVQQYGSGGSSSSTSTSSSSYQKPLYLILTVVFLLNIFILSYFIFHRDWYVDFSEPLHLFSLAVNSPPSGLLRGSCGCGPSGEQLRVGWKMQRWNGHFYVDGKREEEREKRGGFFKVEMEGEGRRGFSATSSGTTATTTTELPSSSLEMMDSPLVGRLKR